MALPSLPCLYCPPDGSPCRRCDDDGPAAACRAESVTIDLGICTGIWADVFARQDALYAKHQRKARTAWRKAIAGLDLAALVAAFRRQALMIDGAPAPGTDHESPQAAKYHKAELRNLARSMAAGFLMGVNDQPDYAGLLAAITGALTAAAGEGTAAALAVSAAGAGYSGFAWDKAHAGRALRARSGHRHRLGSQDHRRGRHGAGRGTDCRCGRRRLRRGDAGRSVRRAP